MNNFSFEFTVKNGEYVALFNNGVTLRVLTQSEVEQTPAKKIEALFNKVGGWPEQRLDGYVKWPDIGRARLLLGLVPRPLRYS